MDTLLTVGLIGALMAATVAIYFSLTAQPPETAPARTRDDLDAELFRIIDDGRLRGF